MLTNTILLDDDLPSFLKVSSATSSSDVINNNVTPFPHFRKSTKSRKRNYANVRHEPQYRKVQKILKKRVIQSPGGAFIEATAKPKPKASDRKNNPNNSQFLTDTEYYQHIMKKNKKLQISSKREKEVITGILNASKAVYDNDANLATKPPKISDISYNPDKAETIPSVVRIGTTSSKKFINQEPSSTVSSIPSPSPYQKEDIIRIDSNTKTLLCCQKALLYMSYHNWVN